MRDVHVVDREADPARAHVLELLDEVDHCVAGAKLPAGRVLEPELRPFPRREERVDAAVGHHHRPGSGGRAGCFELAIRAEAILAAGRVEEDRELELVAQEGQSLIDGMNVGEDPGAQDEPVESLAVVAQRHLVVAPFRQVVPGDLVELRLSQPFEIEDVDRVQQRVRRLSAQQRRSGGELDQFDDLVARAQHGE